MNKISIKKIGWESAYRTLVLFPIICGLILISQACSGTNKVELEEAKTVQFEMVDLPGREFQMGAVNGDDNERPVHTVKIRPFSIGKYEVTQEQWAEVMKENPSTFKAPKSPVENVSWADIQEFLYRIGNGYRLPTEAEWEYAARAGSAADFSIGEDPYESVINEFAWYVSNSGGTTHPVGSKKPNKLGLFDMHGNVWEWCQDHYHKNYDGAPQDGSAWEEGDPAMNRVIRGGGWSSFAFDCRSASRIRYAPGSRRGLVGFRLARTLH